jgi:hypothetical protein
MPDPGAKEKWLQRLAEALRDGSFVKLTLGGPTARGDAPKNVFIRPVELKGGRRLSFVYRHPTRDVTKNVSLEEAPALLNELLNSFRHAHLFTTRSSVELRILKGGAARLIERKGARLPDPATHDRARHRHIDPHAPWLCGLGVTTAGGKVAKGMEAKFRQINKFVEVLEHSLADAGIYSPPGAGELKVVDMGCGKGYLTFAAYDWLARSGWNNATVRGIEARPDLVELCSRVAKEIHFDRLHFETGTISDVKPAPADVLIALHACDTASDDAIDWGVRAGAALIIVSPCCHKELRPQLRPPPALAGALRHGILLEREAELITDALRAALLEWAGYETKVFEFISTEHTAKNLMIAATKRGGATHRAEDARKVRELVALYAIRHQHLAKALGFNLAADTTPT